MKLKFRHKSKGILYVIFERLLPWQMCNQFKRINLSRIDQIPADTPVLIAANHPTAFIDPIIMGDFAHPPLYFMTRGDLFVKPTVRKIFEQFNMFPVKRNRDGFNDPDRMDEVTEYTLAQMKARQALCVFVEGVHHYDKRLMPIQKGIARLAFTAYENLRQDDLQILPVGAAYWATDRPRDVAFMNVGTPIYIKDYWEDYQKSPAAAVVKLCKDIFEALKPLCFHIDNPDDDNFVERLLTLHRSERPIGHWPIFHFSGIQFEGEKKVIEWVNAMPEEEKGLLKKNVKKYLHKVRDAGLTDEALLHPHWASYSHWIFLLLTLPFFLLGYIVRWPIATLAQNMMDNKIKKREFKTSFYFGIELIAGVLWLSLWLILALCTQKAAWIGIALLLPLLYTFSIIYIEVAQRAIQATKAKNHPKRAELLAERTKL